MLAVLFVILARVEPPGGVELVMGEKGYPSRPGWLEPSVPVAVGSWCGSDRGKGPGLSDDNVGEIRQKERSTIDGEMRLGGQEKPDKLGIWLGSVFSGQ